MNRRDFLKATAATATALAGPCFRVARAQSRKDTLLTVSGAAQQPDIMGLGTNRPGYEASWSTYDRLVTFGSKPDANGVDHYDYTKIEPELAESWDLSDTSMTFKLRSGAKFHDRAPVTAQDVKWPFDRAVAVGGFPTFQMAAGLLQKPEQFVAVDGLWRQVAMSTLASLRRSSPRRTTLPQKSSRAQAQRGLSQPKVTRNRPSGARALHGRHAEPGC
jgi:peptide/nickel transport system substrate-binding protein